MLVLSSTLLGACGGGGGDGGSGGGTKTVGIAMNNIGAKTVYLYAGDTVEIHLGAGDLENLKITQAPKHGKITQLQDGSFLYTADGDYEGSDVLLYQVDQSDGGTTVATLTVEIKCPSCPAKTALSLSWQPTYWLNGYDYEQVEGYIVLFGTTPENAVLEVARVSPTDPGVDPLAPSVALDAVADLGLGVGDQACLRVKAYVGDLESPVSEAVCATI
jgi:hypothetical protein